MLRDRYLHQPILSDLKTHMVFMGGPRQVGKTTLAKYIGKQHFPHTYLNWDSREDKKTILARTFPGPSKLIIFDEIHKYRPWKNYLKGEFDKYKDRFSIMVTGSARLDLYRKGGDSLMGRYHYYRLHPFSVAEVFTPQGLSVEAGKELVFSNSLDKKRQKIFKDLFKFGGFPEPFLSKDAKTLRRFHNERLDRLVKEDIRDVETLRDLSAIQILVEMLPEKVGSLLSINSLREDLQVTHKTISLWMDILERFYYHFRIRPFSARRIQSLRKEPKMYLWDWSQLEDEGAKFENIIASHLLKFVHFLYDTEGYKAELYFLRDTAGREVDFLVTINKKPWFAVEAKLSSSKISPHLKYFHERLTIPYVYQVVKAPDIDFFKDSFRVISADKFLSALV